METLSKYAFEKWDKDLLIDYAIKIHHRGIRKNGPKIIALCEELIEKYPQNEVLSQMYSQMSESYAALCNHLDKEEQVLFPYLYELYNAYTSEQKIEQIHCGSIANPIRVMIMEHSQEDNRFACLKQQTNNFTTSVDDEQYQELVSALKEFIDAFYEHIFIENEIIFPFFENIEKDCVNMMW